MTILLKTCCVAALIAFTLFAGPYALAQNAQLEANKKIAYEAIELWLSGTKVKPEAILAPDYTNHQDTRVGFGTEPPTWTMAKFKAELKKYHAAFSDVKVTSRVQVAEGDMVATRVVLSAVHTGTYIDEPPTRKTIHYDSVEIVRIKDGKIAETWETWDKYGMFKQIGLIK